MSSASAFEKRSILAARQFLQTALILDDQAYPPDEQEDEGEQEDANIVLDVPEPFEADESDDEGMSANAITAATHGNIPIHTKEISREFAKLGIVCAVLDPDEDTDAWLPLQPDITVLDWYIRDETGERALMLLEALISVERSSYPHQLRLVLVYTTEQDLLGIRERVSALLEGLGGESPAEFGKTGLMWEGWHFIVLAKPETPVATDLVEFVVDYADLPKRVVSEFSSIVRGLLPHAAISGLTAIRRNTHRILCRFSSSLDPAFLTHSALLLEPSDAEEHLISLLGSELMAVLEDEKVAEISNSAAIREWIGTRNLNYPLKVKCEEHDVEVSNRRQIGDLLTKGVYSHSRVKDLDQDGEAKERLVKRFRTQLTALLEGTSKYDDSAFSELMTFRPHYGAVPPKLTLGTIVFNSASNSHWLCVQPKCDSVRLDTTQPFMFIPLKEASSFDICMPQGESKPLKLQRERKVHLVKSYKFTPDEIGVVRARSRNGDYEFTTSGSVKLMFVGQLRDDVAQDVAHRLATRLSRVGVNVSEWQRRSLPRAIRDQ